MASTDYPSDRPAELDDAEDLERLLDRRDRVLVELYTKGCTLCQSMEPVLTNVAREVDATVATLNAGRALDLSGELDLRRVPTLILFEDGEEVGRIDDGFVGADRLVEFVETRGRASRS